MVLHQVQMGVQDQEGQQLLSQTGSMWIQPNLWHWLYQELHTHDEQCHLAHIACCNDSVDVGCNYCQCWNVFLHRDLEEEIYMNFLDGMEWSNDKCLLLLKALYGLVQGAHQWWNKFIDILKNIKFKRGFANPCLLMIKHSNDGTVFASIYVNDNYCVGHSKALKTFMEDLKKQASWWRCWRNWQITWAAQSSSPKTGRIAWVGQLHLIAKFQEKFGHLVNKMQSYSTSGTHQRIVKVQEDWIKISKEEQSFTTQLWASCCICWNTQDLAWKILCMNCQRPSMEQARVLSRNSSTLSSLYSIQQIMGSRWSQLRSQ